MGWDATSAELLGSYLGRPASDEGMTIFKSVGSVEQDLVLAFHLITASQQSQRGVWVPDVASLRVMR